VKNIRITTRGGVIRPGEEVMQIVPLEDDLIIEAKVMPADIAFIKPGLSATVKIDAYDYTIYGDLPGKLIYISADTLTDDLNDWCASARQALVQPLLERLDRALRPEHRYAVLAGGVAANRLLRREAQEWASRKGIAMGIPPLSYATDNAAMIGAVAYYAFSEQRFSALGRAASARLEVPSLHD
jgi:hypothetical protein